MTLLRIVAALLFFGLGAVSAVAGVLVHADWWGALLLWAVVVALLVALPARWYGRVAFSLGWIVILVQALGTRPEGDFLVASDLSGYLFLATAPVLVVASVLALARGGSGPQRGAELRSLDRSS